MIYKINYTNNTTVPIPSINNIRFIDKPDVKYLYGYGEQALVRYPKDYAKREDPREGIKILDFEQNISCTLSGEIIYVLTHDNLHTVNLCFEVVNTQSFLPGSEEVHPYGNILKACSTDEYIYLEDGKVFGFSVEDPKIEKKFDGVYLISLAVINEEFYIGVSDETIYLIKIEDAGHTIVTSVPNIYITDETILVKGNQFIIFEDFYLKKYNFVLSPPAITEDDCEIPNIEFEPINAVNAKLLGDNIYAQGDSLFVINFDTLEILKDIPRNAWLIDFIIDPEPGEETPSIECGE